MAVETARVWKLAVVVGGRTSCWRYRHLAISRTPTLLSIQPTVFFQEKWIMMRSLRCGGIDHSSGQKSSSLHASWQVARVLFPERRASFAEHMSFKYVLQLSIQNWEVVIFHCLNELATGNLSKGHRWASFSIMNIWASASIAHGSM